MPNRTKTAASPIFAAFLASALSTAIACATAGAADDCLSEPKRQTPAGSHWYYRIDGPNHRKCWFLGDQGQKASQAASPRPSSPLSLRPPTAAAIQPSVADAHAELPKVTTSTEPRSTEPPRWLGPTRMNLEKMTEVVPDARPSETLSPPSTRDPEGETRVVDNGVIDGQSRTESRTELLSGATDREPAAELSAEQTAPSPLATRLAQLLIALGLSTLAGSLIFKLSAAVQTGRREVFPSR